MFVCVRVCLCVHVCLCARVVYLGMGVRVHERRRERPRGHVQMCVCASERKRVHTFLCIVCV
jgi:hypothetical protein